MELGIRFGLIEDSLIGKYKVELLFVLLNILLKSVCLTQYNIDLDEPYTLFYAQQTLPELFSIFKTENNPPLYFAILHFWVKIFGVGVLSARFLPMLFSSLAVGFVYKLGVRFHDSKTAIGASLLYTFSNLIIMESHEGRVYSLVVLLAVASMYYFYSSIESGAKRRDFILLTLANILMVYAHFLASLIVVLQVVCVLGIPEIRKTFFKHYLRSLLILGIAYLPYLFIFFQRFTSTLHNGIHQPDLSFSGVLVSFLGTFGNGFWSASFFVLILVLFLTDWVQKRFKNLTVFEQMTLGWFWILYPMLVVISLKLPVLSISKYIIFAVPGFFLAVMVALKYLTEGHVWIRNSLLILSVALMVAGTNLNSSLGFESSKVVAHIQKHKTDSTMVVIAPRWIDVVFAYHYDIEAFKDYRNLYAHLNADMCFPISSAQEMDAEAMNRASDVYLIDGWYKTVDVDPNFEIWHTLKDRFGGGFSQTNFQGYTVYHFERASSDGSFSNQKIKEDVHGH